MKNSKKRKARKLLNMKPFTKAYNNAISGSFNLKQGPKLPTDLDDINDALGG